MGDWKFLSCRERKMYQRRPILCSLVSHFVSSTLFELCLNKHEVLPFYDLEFWFLTGEVVPSGTWTDELMTQTRFFASLVHPVF